MAAGTIKPIYVLYGDDLFLRDCGREEIIARALGDADAKLCVISFDSSVELAEVLDELRTLPFLGPRRVVIVRDAGAFVSRYRTELEQYLESPCTSGLLVLMVSSWPSNTRLYKLVRRIGEAINCSRPNLRSLPRRLGQAAARRGKKISRDACELLCEWIGPDLAALDAEMEKLSLFVGGRGTITIEDVSSLVAATAGPGPFDLTNAITAGDTAAALKALAGMLTARGAEFRILGQIAWHLRRALQGRQLAEAGDSPAKALSQRTPPAARKAFLAMVSRRSLQKLHADFRCLIGADLAMKSGADPQGTMQELVAELCM